MIHSYEDLERYIYTEIKKESEFMYQSEKSRQFFFLSKFPGLPNNHFVHKRCGSKWNV